MINTNDIRDEIISLMEDFELPISEYCTTDTDERNELVERLIDLDNVSVFLDEISSIMEIEENCGLDILRDDLKNMSCGTFLERLVQIVVNSRR